MQGIDIKPDAQGKVRDLYDLGDKLLLVATDRISAFDYILKDDIPYKGQAAFLLLVRAACRCGGKPSHLGRCGRPARKVQALCRLSSRPFHARTQG